MHEGAREFHRDLNITNYKLREWEIIKYDVGSFFVLHNDNVGDRYLRMVSFSTLLDKSDDLEGGDLILYINNEAHKVELNIGDTIMFDSTIEHEVTPITKGNRTVLINWSFIS